MGELVLPLWLLPDEKDLVQQLVAEHGFAACVSESGSMVRLNRRGPRFDDVVFLIEDGNHNGYSMALRRPLMVMPSEMTPGPRHKRSLPVLDEVPGDPKQVLEAVKAWPYEEGGDSL